MKKDPRMFIGHIIECLELLEGYIKGVTKKALEKDEKTTDAIIRRIEIIGETTKNLPKTLKDDYPAIPWKDIAGMRDIVVHQYYGIEVDEIWKVVKIDAPQLKKQIKNILKNLEKGGKSDKVFLNTKVK